MKKILAVPYCKTSKIDMLCFFPDFKSSPLKNKNHFQLQKCLVSDEEDSCDCGTEISGRFKRVGRGKKHFQPSKVYLLRQVRQVRQVEVFLLS